jgi:hypothetical protein
MLMEYNKKDLLVHLMQNIHHLYLLVNNLLLLIQQILIIYIIQIIVF